MTACSTRPGNSPAASDAAPVGYTDYDAGGRVLDTVDPRGVVTRYAYDLAGRTATTIEAYDAAVNAGQPSGSNNRTTAFTYDGGDHVLTRRALMPAGANAQTTAYAYGVAGGSSNVFSNDLLAKVEYPDASTGNASAAAADDQVYAYNALGEKAGFTDQDQTTHAYARDVLGRLTLDAATALGGGVDGAVRALGYSYDGQGLPFRQTSYSGTTTASTVVNQVQEQYNGLGQLTADYQAHGGSVVTSGSNATPSVRYAYSEMLGGTNAANHSRLVSMTYPNGRVLDYNYNVGLDDTISRVSSLADAGGNTMFKSVSFVGDILQYDYRQIRKCRRASRLGAQSSSK